MAMLKLMLLVVSVDMAFAFQGNIYACTLANDCVPFAVIRRW